MFKLALSTGSEGEIDKYGDQYDASMHHYWWSCGQQSTNRLWLFTFNLRYDNNT